MIERKKSQCQNCVFFQSGKCFVNGYSQDSLDVGGIEIVGGDIEFVCEKYRGRRAFVGMDLATKIDRSALLFYIIPDDGCN